MNHTSFGIVRSILDDFDGKFGVQVWHPNAILAAFISSSRPRNRTGLQQTNKKRYLLANKSTFISPVQTPSQVDLTTLPYYPSAYDQGDLGSCTANAVAFAYQFDVLKKNANDPFMPSRLFLYFCERFLDQSNYDPYASPPLTNAPAFSTTQGLALTDDSGSQDFQGIDVLQLYGVCNESLWPYDVTAFAQIPSANWTAINANRVNHMARSFYAVGNLTKQYDASAITGDVIFFDTTQYQNDLASIKQALAQGFPVVFGITIPNDTDQQLQNYTNSVVSTSQYVNSMDYVSNSSNFSGGHAIVIVGYDDNRQAFLIRNSWGTDWGINGHFYLAYTFVSNPNLANDFWVLSDVNELTFT